MLVKKIKLLFGPIADFIHLAAQLADQKGLPVYAVGGFVRDLLLEADHLDVDLVVEGDGIAFAVECGRHFGARLIAHRRFGTATLLGVPGVKADIASARKEIYEKPAALPTVFQGTIKDDLFRRDFTINAMAVRINRAYFGELIDFYGGQKDLKAKRVRALHPLSFIDDPTRIVRAVRFEQRLNFKIEKDTLDWIRRAVERKMLQSVQKHRLRDELLLIFKEPAPLKALKRLHELCGFTAIAPLRFQKNWPALFEAARQRIAWFQAQMTPKRHLESYTVYLSLFFFPLGLKDLRRAIGDFAFHKSESSRILALKTHFEKINRHLAQKKCKPSSVYRCLESLSYETILAIAVLSRSRWARQRIEDFFLKHHGHRLGVRGEDLRNFGIPPGPRYKNILQELLYAKIDGKITSKEEELRLAQKIAQRAW
ncbi:MAG: hypothetical protein V1863_03610 [Candidatus Omnitrophota bacterium]